MSDASILVACFSRSGRTRQLASALASMLDADFEEICDYGRRAGLRGFLRSLFEAFWKRPVEIVPAGLDAAAYDLVVIGSPVWAGSVSSPVRAYLVANKGRFHHVAFFCSLRSRGAESALDEMRVLAGKGPIATCSVTARELKHGQYSKPLAEFAGRIRRRKAEADELEWMC